MSFIAPYAAVSLSNELVTSEEMTTEPSFTFTDEVGLHSMLFILVVFSNLDCLSVLLGVERGSSGVEINFLGDTTEIYTHTVKTGASPAITANNFG